jgi:hypothetical protein
VRGLTKVARSAAATGITALLLAGLGCGSDDSSASPAASSPDASTGTVNDGGTTADSGGSADAAPASEGMVSGLGSYGETSLSELTHALSEVTPPPLGVSGTELQVVLTELASCRDVDGGPSANAVFLELSLYTAATGSDGGTARVAAAAPGTYSLDETGPGPYAQAYVIVFDATCHAEAFGSGKLTAGTVTVTSVSASSVVGSYALTGDVGPITGTFATVPCSGAYDLVAPASTAGCH